MPSDIHLFLSPSDIYLTLFRTSLFSFHHSTLPGGLWSTVVALSYAVFVAHIQPWLAVSIFISEIQFNELVTFIKYCRLIFI